MNKIKNITYKDNNQIITFISKHIQDFNYFTRIGWNKENLSKQLIKKNNLCLGHFKSNTLIGFIMGDIIPLDDKAQLDVYILFVAKEYRRNNIATNLINYIETTKNSHGIYKIYIEVAENNFGAIKFYQKNNFVYFNFRHNYYKYENKNFNAKCFLKTI